MFSSLRGKTDPVKNPSTTEDSVNSSQHTGPDARDIGILSPEKVLTSNPKIAPEVVDSLVEENVPVQNAQKGVVQAEAITLAWNKTSLGTAYVLMFLLYFVNAFQSSITGNLSPYITSGFEEHSLLPVITVVSGAIGSASYMPVAKILNLWDRSVGLVLMASFATLGLVLSAACTDITTYCAAQVFYTIGFNGLIFCVDVITADTSKLRDRGLAYAFTSSPYIITTFAGAAASEHFYDWNWRWAYGIFAIILPFVALPFFVLLQWNRRKATKQGILQKREKSGKTYAQSIWYYVVEFDILGVFLLSGGLTMFLLPFTLAGSGDGWASGSMIALIVVGFCSLVAFVVVEKFFVRVPFLPWELLTSRTILGACLLDLVYQVSYYCWYDFYTSYLQVVYGTSITKAGFIANIFNVVSGIWLFIVGILIKKTHRFKWLLYWSMPMYLLGIGLMIYFRNPGWGLGYQVMCNIFMSFGGSSLIIIMQVAVTAASDHEHFASVLALLGVFGTMGGAIGGSVSGAIWQGTFPQALQRLLPADALEVWEDIYNDLDTQLSYPMGSDTRTAIMESYAIAQKNMLIAGTCVMVLGLVFAAMIKNIRLTKEIQNKGVLF